MRYLGIDFGTKKVGLALSDEAGTMGFPYGVVANDKHLFSTVCALIEKEGVAGVVVGESLNFSGQENPVMADAHRFGEKLVQETGLPLFLEPEILTTQEALRDPEGVRGKGGGGMIDAQAAALILTSYLSRTTHA